MMGDLFKNPMSQLTKYWESMGENAKVNVICGIGAIIFIMVIVTLVAKDGADARAADVAEALKTTSAVKEATEVIDHGEYVTVRYNGEAIRYNKEDLEPMMNARERKVYEVKAHAAAELEIARVHEEYAMARAQIILREEIYMQCSRMVAGAFE